MTAEQLKAWRASLNLSQPDAAKALGVPVSSYRQWEQGRREPPALLGVACDGVRMVRRAPEKAVQRKVAVVPMAAAKSSTKRAYGSLLKNK